MWAVGDLADNQVILLNTKQLTQLVREKKKTTSSVEKISMKYIWMEALVKNREHE